MINSATPILALLFLVSFQVEARGLFYTPETYREIDAHNYNEEGEWCDEEDGNCGG